MLLRCGYKTGIPLIEPECGCEEEDPVCGWPAPPAAKGGFARLLSRLGWREHCVWLVLLLKLPGKCKPHCLSCNARKAERKRGS